MKRSLLLLLAVTLIFALTAVAMAEEGVKTWEDLKTEYENSISETETKNAPKVQIAANGIKIQRTPSDAGSFNNAVLNADSRGCGACHFDLTETLNKLSVIASSTSYGHFNFENDMGIETTIRQCYVCHVAQDYWLPQLQSMLHGIHESAAFTAVGGTCWSCHYADEQTGKMLLWDNVKYQKLHGIIPVSDVKGEFSYSQDVMVDRLFGLNWLSADIRDEHYYSNYLGLEPDPESDGIYDAWTITVSGDVENETVFTLAELIEKAPKVTKKVTAQCAINPLGGPFIGNVEITGIPVMWILEQAGLKEGANIFHCYSTVNRSYGHEISTLEKHPAYLVYEINGKPVPFKNGYPVVGWFEAATAADNRKQVTNILVSTGDIKDNNPSYFNYTYYGYYGDCYDNVPNIGICNFRDGQIINKSEPYTFEGYASGFREDIVTGEKYSGTPVNENQEPEAIAAIEISFDQGKTWTRCETFDATADRWVYWNFTWTPEAEGAYVISLRAVRADGQTTPYPLEKLFNVQ